jgi:hypothetical protein
MVFFHELKHDSKVYLLIGTEDSIDRLLKLYRNEEHSLKTLWQVTDITALDCAKYHKIKIVN